MSEAEPENVVTLDISHSELNYEVPKTKQFFAAPHLNVGVGIGGDFVNKQATISANAAISLFAYGRTRSDNSLRFLNIRGELGTALSTGQAPGRMYLGIGIDPVIINIGEPLPLLDDLYLGAGITGTMLVPDEAFTSGGQSAPPPLGGLGLSITLSSTI